MLILKCKSAYFYHNTIKLISFVMLQEQIGFQFYLLSIKYIYNNTLKSD